MEKELELMRPGEQEAPGDASRLWGLIERGATDKSMDVEKMERLVGLYERLDKRRAEKEFNEAMMAAQQDMPPIVKTSRNPSTNSMYVKLEHVQEVVTPIAFKHGLTLSYGSDESKLAGHYGVTCLVTHKGGHERLYRCDVPCDDLGMKGTPNKTKTHGFGSAISYGSRYLMKLIFNLRLIGEDDDGNQGNRPKSQGPSDGPVTDAEKEKQERTKLNGDLWRILEPVRGTEQNWQKANQWLWNNDLLDGAVPETPSRISLERLRALIPKVKEKLKQ